MIDHPLHWNLLFLVIWSTNNKHRYLQKNEVKMPCGWRGMQIPCNLPMERYHTRVQVPCTLGPSANSVVALWTQKINISMLAQSASSVIFTAYELPWFTTSYASSAGSIVWVPVRHPWCTRLRRKSLETCCIIMYCIIMLYHHVMYHHV